MHIRQINTLIGLKDTQSLATGLAIILSPVCKKSHCALYSIIWCFATLITCSCRRNVVYREKGEKYETL
jgi:hypothetical protein